MTKVGKPTTNQLRSGCCCYLFPWHTNNNSSFQISSPHRKRARVQRLLRYKHIQNAMKYTQLVHFKDDGFDVATATTVEEAKELLAVSFDYVTEKNGIMLFRRSKRLGV